MSHRQMDRQTDPEATWRQIWKTDMEDRQQNRDRFHIFRPYNCPYLAL